MTSLWHLTKRLVGAAVAQPLRSTEVNEVAAILTPAELQLFKQLSTSDQRHALHVLRRFDAFVAEALHVTPPIAARRAALLHDIGKVQAPLGTLLRVVATVVGPRTASFRRYHEHEAIGVTMLEHAGSDVTTLMLLRGQGDAQLLAVLRRADAI
jgi:response regulator RpfG family c-di-GMP phosphodiesterase